MKYKITKVENDTMTIEVLDGTKIILTKEFPITLESNLDKIKEQLRMEVATQEVKEREKEREENKKDEFKGLLNKQFDL